MYISSYIGGTVLDSQIPSGSAEASVNWVTLAIFSHIRQVKVIHQSENQECIKKYSDEN